MDENEFEGKMMCYQKDVNSCRRLRSKVRNFQGVNLAMMMLWQIVMRSATRLKSGLGGKQITSDTNNSTSIYTTFPILFTGPRTGLSGMHLKRQV
jgi:hypothetical protein